MQVRVPVIVKDPVVTAYKDIPPTENIDIEDETFLDGPVSPRVAVLDFEPGTGALAVQARFVAPKAGRVRGSYEVPRPLQAGDQSVDPITTSVSVFGAVHKTIELFEESDALGRRVDWAFDAPQLLVVPRAGQMANAYYERESHSLQFFSFTDSAGRVTSTANSQDIVAHETAHALLDGVAPDLYSAITPQSLAMHEAIADLASLLVSLRCRDLRIQVLTSELGNIGNSNAFSGLAEEFAMALERQGHFLRNLNNTTRLQDVPDDEPHDLSTVLSGAFYKLLLKIYGELRSSSAAGPTPGPPVVPEPEAEYVISKTIADETPVPSSEATRADATALFVAAERIKRTLIRGLDYLPPGDVNFADVARAVLASDEASHPDSPSLRRWLADEFVARGIVPSRSDLDVRTNFARKALREIDIAELVASDFVAYQFAQDNRAWLKIPPNTAFEVRPRLDVTKLYWHRDGRRTVREVLFKVAWSEVEDNQSGGGLPTRRRYRAGTTLAIGLDRPAPYVRTLISSSRTQSDRAATDSMLKALIDSEQLHVSAIASSGRPLLGGAISADVGSGVLRVQGMARMLHLTRETR